MQVTRLCIPNILEYIAGNFNSHSFNQLHDVEQLVCTLNVYLSCLIILSYTFTKGNLDDPPANWWDTTFKRCLVVFLYLVFIKMYF